MSEKFSFSNFFGTNEEREEKVNSLDTSSRKRSNSNSPKIVPMKSKDLSNKVSIFEPRIYADSKVIAAKLIDGDAVIINLARASKDSLRRIIDFLTGCVYTIDGDIKRIDDKVFLCTPHGVNVSGGMGPNFEGQRS